ncbi:glycerol-3-phosphate 1-O-acyltransferase PlsY [Thiohalophilus thiocyanatoxydans]|uniref:Glycerol-3-phosphate acyltransferase n=1 Tax=Thiohalophilus thiocyanatoxydans TaxID=381308 RepID=A0A4R8INM1_9GAMM|nr:glycerol-3-phosphate 1-O-acyltransferase PlsY [Thiohalophilus thiocyanatoxydans]TDX98165.1 acyl-phosphate glycerol-3-phosphate acyltransferase [Thiohalophilus thiocyanatoxydans]
MDIIDYTLIAGAYLLGSLSSAIIVCKLAGLPDPRGQGSGNPGATNVLRLGSRKAAAVTLLGDMLKGLLPVLLAVTLQVSPPVLGLVGFAAFVGHLYPVFFQFRGGKGVATLLGVLFGFNLWAGLATAATWLFIAKGLKISSLSALVAMALAPLFVWLFAGAQWALILATLAMVVLSFWRHRSNIARLVKGEESLIGKS